LDSGRPWTRFLAALLVWLLPASGFAAQAPGATRILPGFFEDQVLFRVLVEVTPPDSASVHSVEERFPLGWRVSEVTHGGTIDLAGHSLRWGPFADNLPRTLGYKLMPPIDFSFEGVFQGTAVFNTNIVPIQGPTTLVKRPGRVERTLPSSYLPGQPIEVQLAVRPGASALAWALQETIPDGWSPSSTPTHASFDPRTRALKWGPFLDPAPRGLTYSLRPNLVLRTPAVFSGTAIFESTPVPVTGDSTFPLRSSRITRVLPPPFTPGTLARIQIEADPAPYVETYTVEEDVPAGLNPDVINHGGIWDPIQRRIKWGPFRDANRRTLKAEVLPASDLRLPADLLAEGWFDAQQIVAAGNSRVQPTPSVVSRTLPPRFTPGVPFIVHIEFQPAPTVELAFIEDAVPADSTLSQISEGGSFDAAQSKVKWGPFPGSVRRSLSYRVTPSGSPRQNATFSGAGVFDALAVPIAGDQIAALNHAPTAQPDPIQRPPIRSAKFSVIEVLANDSDVDADTLRIRGVGATSAAGASVRMTVPWIYYEIASGPPIEDQFSYTVEDAYGL